MRPCIPAVKLCKQFEGRYAAEQDTVLMLLQRVQEAQRIAIRELKDQDFDGKTVDSAAALEAEVGGGGGGVVAARAVVLRRSTVVGA